MCMKFYSKKEELYFKTDVSGFSLGAGILQVRDGRNVMLLASSVITLMYLATTGYCLLMYNCTSSMYIYSVLYCINIYRLEACLWHGLHMLYHMAQFVTLNK